MCLSACLSVCLSVGEDASHIVLRVVVVVATDTTGFQHLSGETTAVIPEDSSHCRREGSWSKQVREHRSFVPYTDFFVQKAHRNVLFYLGSATSLCHFPLAVNYQRFLVNYQTAHSWLAETKSYRLAFQQHTTVTACWMVKPVREEKVGRWHRFCVCVFARVCACVRAFRSTSLYCALRSRSSLSSRLF